MHSTGKICTSEKTNASKLQCLNYDVSEIERKSREFFQSLFPDSRAARRATREATTSSRTTQPNPPRQPPPPPPPSAAVAGGGVKRRRSRFFLLLPLSFHGIQRVFCWRRRCVLQQRRRCDSWQRWPIYFGNGRIRAVDCRIYGVPTGILVLHVHGRRSGSGHLRCPGRAGEGNGFCGRCDGFRAGSRRRRRGPSGGSAAHGGGGGLATSAPGRGGGSVRCGARWRHGNGSTLRMARCFCAWQG
uniref:Uncharacterized protein n=1 Tax=Setaria viridis TaxID=4556 RepID=A0A4U6SVY7_SETVI|nr:hypothetical protein SEVIR_9G163650v2 [Setaria viridis]